MSKGRPANYTGPFMRLSRVILFAIVCCFAYGSVARANSISTVTADIPNYCLQTSGTSAACTATAGNTGATASASISSSGDIVTAVTASASNLSNSWSFSTATVSPQGDASGSISDVLTINAPGLTTGYAEISSDLTGSYTVNCSGGGSGDCAFDADILSDGTWEGSTLYFLNCQGEGCGVNGRVSSQDPTYTRTLSPGNGYASPNTFLEPIVFGDSYDFSYSLEIYADVNCYEAEGFPCPLGGSASITGSFSDPPVIQILDANKNPVTDATILSADGFNYMADAASATPEPSSLMLVATGLLGTAGLLCQRAPNWTRCPISRF